MGKGPSKQRVESDREEDGVMDSEDEHHTDEGSGDLNAARETSVEPPPAINWDDGHLGNSTDDEENMEDEDEDSLGMASDDDAQVDQRGDSDAEEERAPSSGKRKKSKASSAPVKKRKENPANVSSYHSTTKEVLATAMGIGRSIILCEDPWIKNTDLPAMTE